MQLVYCNVLPGLISPPEKSAHVTTSTSPGILATIVLHGTAIGCVDTSALLPDVSFTTSLFRTFVVQEHG